MSGVCIYLPPGYEDGTTRYPVLYLLHGAFGWQEDWFRQGGAQAVLDEAYAEDPNNAMIVVTPDGTYDATWSDDPSGYPLNETYVFDHVIPYVDTYLRTIPDRRGRAMSGLEQRRRRNPAALGPAPGSLLGRNGDVCCTSRQHGREPNGRTGGRERSDRDRREPGARRPALIYGRDPCGPDDPSACATYGGAWAFESACCSNELYKAQARPGAGTAVRVRRGRRRARLALLDRMAARAAWSVHPRAPDGPHPRRGRSSPPLEAPESFDYRGIKASFEMYDYTFTNDPGRARGVPHPDRRRGRRPDGSADLAR